MKILQVNCVYKTGSTGKITYDLHTGLKSLGLASVVCYGRGEKYREPNVYKTCSEWYSRANNLLTRVTGLMYGGCVFSTNRLMRVIKKEKPDVVHLHCINGYFVNIYRLLTWLKKQRIPTVVTLHAEFMYTANCGIAFDCEKWQTGCGRCPRLREETGALLLDRTHRSWEKMRKAFAGSEDIFYITSVSPWLQDRAKRSPMLAHHRHAVVYNGLDGDVFLSACSLELEQRYREGGKKLVLHVTARFGDPNKGGRYVLELAKLLGEDYRIILVGNDLPAQDQLPDNVVCVGPVHDPRQLAAFYAMCDVTVLTSKKETFSMICAESLCCGTPVVGFRAGGPEQIALPDYSRFCDFGDVGTLADMVRSQAGRTDGEECATLARKTYSKEVMTGQYLQVYETIWKLNGGSL